jgi:hypothetical protein
VAKHEELRLITRFTDKPVAKIVQWDTLYEITPPGPLLEGEYALYGTWKGRVLHSKTWTIGFDYR